MPLHDTTTLSGTIRHVFAHRFTIEADGQTHLADLGPKGADAFALAEDYLSKGLLDRALAEIRRVAVAGADPVQAALLTAVRESMAGAFSHTLWVAAILTALTLIPAYFLPRKQEKSHLLDDAEGDEVTAPVLMH